MRRSFATRPLRQRVIALVAAYAIAFAGVIASFVAAQAAVEAATLAHTIICHSSVTEKPALPSGNPDGKISVDCCFGCVTSLGVAVPPTATTVIVPQVLVKDLIRLPTSSACSAPTSTRIAREYIFAFGFVKACGGAGRCTVSRADGGYSCFAV